MLSDKPNSFDQSRGILLNEVLLYIKPERALWLALYKYNLSIRLRYTCITKIMLFRVRVKRKVPFFSQTGTEVCTIVAGDVDEGNNAAVTYILYETDEDNGGKCINQPRY